MSRHFFPVALLVVVGALCTAAGCSRQQPAQQAGDASAPTTDVIRMAALCHEHGGEWIKSTGCRMTEKLCTSTYHGAWNGPNCTMARAELKNCNNAGVPVGADKCSVAFLDLDESQEMK
jgi:hypothetical protein